MPVGERKPPNIGARQLELDPGLLGAFLRGLEHRLADVDTDHAGAAMREFEGVSPIACTHVEHAAPVDRTEQAQHQIPLEPFGDRTESRATPPRVVLWVDLCHGLRPGGQVPVFLS
jgi:hypothetical protein